jgi:glycerophosphoryl diester phosphodiesterase
MRAVPPWLYWFVDRVCRGWCNLLAFEVIFQVLNLVVLAPVAAWTTRRFLQRWGRCSVGNFEVAAFLISPVGIVTLVTVGGFVLATVYLQIAGLMKLLDDPERPWWAALVGRAGEFPRLVALGAVQMVVYLLLAAPFLLGVWLAYRAFWSGRDLYGLMIVRPPAFWFGAAIAGGLAAVYAVLGGLLFVRWLFALPSLLFEPEVSLRRALGSSFDRTRGRLVLPLGALVVWFVAQAGLTAAVLGLSRVLAGWLLQRLGSSLAVAIPVTAAVLMVYELLVLGLAMIGNLTFAAMVLALYQSVAPDVATGSASQPGTRHVRSRWPLACVAMVGLLVATESMSYRLLSTLALDDRIAITAHRGASRAAPENTVAAIRKAAEAKADWVEIDVQRTRDGAVVVMHDTDLARIGGGPAHVGDVTFETIRALDVGRLFSTAYTGERVPTLEEVLDAARDRIRLTIEFKPHGPANVAPLVESTLERVRRAGMIAQVRYCSQSYESLKLNRRLEPGSSVGFIAANALGDLTRLDVDFLMVKFDMATRRLVERAAARGLPVHVWTVNEPATLARWLDRGVQCVITDDPVRMRERLAEIQDLRPVDRLLLRVRDALTD